MTVTYFEIPLVPKAQTLFVTLKGVLYFMTLAWRTHPEGGWFLDIADQNTTPIVQGIPLVTGANLLAQYADKAFGFTLRVATDGDANAVPTYSGLGVTSHLYAGVES